MLRLEVVVEAEDEALLLEFSYSTNRLPCSLPTSCGHCSSPVAGLYTRMV